MLRLLGVGFALSLIAASFFALTGQPEMQFEDTVRRKPDGTLGGSGGSQLGSPFKELALPGDRLEVHQSALILPKVAVFSFLEYRLIRDGRELRRWNDTALHPMVIMMLVALIPFGLSAVAALFWRRAAGR